MKVNDLLKLSIRDVGLGGPAIARHEGLVVQLDRGLPGDDVEARVTRVRRQYVEAGLVAVVRPSPDRVAAPCPHVGRCGGCRFQDLAYAAQCRLKERQVREALARIGGLADPPVQPITPAPELFGYRNKMEFSFHPGPGGEPVLGLHERAAPGSGPRSFERVFALETCLLPSPLTVEIVRATQRFAAAHGWRAYHPRLHQGDVRFLTVRHLPHTDECAVHLVAAATAIAGLDAWARAVAALSPAVRTVSLLVNRARAAVAVGEEEILLHGDGRIVERLLDLEFEVSANAFLQTNSRQAEALYARALAAADLAGGERVLDLYCGTGTLTLLFARAAGPGGAATGVDSVPQAVESARRNARRNGLGDVRFETGEARVVLREWAWGARPSPGRVDVVVLDPPRAGLHPRVVARVAELAPRRIVYVSCNPATLARDLGDFGSRGYRTVEVAPFDMFPHTPHIECVVRLEPPA